MDLVGQRVVLTRFRPEIADTYARWLGDPYIQQMAGEQAATADEVLERQRNWTQCETFAEYIVLDRATGEPIGDASLDFAGPQAKLGIMIGESAYRRRGCAAEAVQLLCGFAEQFGASCVVAEIHDVNEVSRRFHERLGFEAVRYDESAREWVYRRMLGRSDAVVTV